MRWLRRVRLTILHFADRTCVVADVLSSSKLLKATPQHTVAAPTTIIFCTDEGYEFTLSLYNLAQVAYYFPPFLPHFWLKCHSLFLYLFRIFLILVFTVSVSIFVSLFLPPYFSIIMLCFFVAFLSLAPRIKFSFLLCSSLLSVICLHLFFFLLISSSFHVLFLVSCSCLFSLPVFIPYCLSSLSNFTFSPDFYIVLLPPFSVSFSRLLFSPFHIFSRNFFPLDDSQDTQTYTLHKLRRDIYIPVMQTFWRELTTAK